MSTIKVLGSLAMSAGIALLLSYTAAAERPRPKPKVTRDSAEAIARAAVPTGKVTAGEYEHEKGRWIWSLELKVPGKPGIEEVNVDAMTGRVVSREHEGAKAEAREERAEKKTGKP